MIAESFERIYRQNADNIGLFTSTDLGLVDRIQAGEPIAIDELVAGRDALAQAILRAGGLLAFGQQHMREVRRAPERPADAARPRTLFEKIVARHALATDLTAACPAVGDGAFVRADWRFIHEYYTGMCAHMLHARFGRPLMLKATRHRSSSSRTTPRTSSESPAHVAGGLVPNIMAMVQAQRDFVADHALRCHRTLTEAEAALDDGSNVAGISHAMMAEHYALPGQLVVGTDSHTPHSGALGCVAFGVGTTDMANAFVTGAVRLTVPPSLRVELDGALAAGVTAKDVVLHLLALPAIRAGRGVGKVFEFTGDAVSAMSTDERATLTNMTAELGGFTGIVAPDAETVRFLAERRGVDFVARAMDAQRRRCRLGGANRRRLCRHRADGRAPGRPRQCRAAGRHWRTGAGGHRLRRIVHRRQARGLRPLPPRAALGCRPWLARAGARDAVPAIRHHGGSRLLLERGYLAAFEAVGARLLQPSCGACGNCGPGTSVSPDTGDGQRDQPQLPGTRRPGAGVAGEPADGCGERDRGAAGVLRRVEAAARGCRCLAKT